MFLHYKTRDCPLSHFYDDKSAGILYNGSEIIDSYSFGGADMSNQKIMVCDGNEAAAYVAYAFSEVATIYPITPSSPMAEKTDEWSARGRKNLYTQPVTLVEMQSEAGAVGAMHGALESGSLAVSFTSSQGLMLMIPTMHRISGTRLPAVLHVASRTVGTHAMSIFGDHSDVMNCRQTGWAMLSTGSVQEVMDLAGVAHLSAIRARIPFLHFFDGFRTSHEIQKIRAISYDDFEKMIDWAAVRSFRESALNPWHPSLRNTVQNPDVYFQFREANNRFYDALPDIVEEYMQKINEVTKEDYHLFNYYGAADAEYVIVAMGSASGTIRETVDALNAEGKKTGFVQVHLFNPFSRKHFLRAIPSSVRKIAVLDRCKEMGAAGEPLYLAVASAQVNDETAPFICGGRYGLSSKDVTPNQIKAVFDHLMDGSIWNSFSVGIEDDVTHLSLSVPSDFCIDHEGIISCKFWGLGSDGTVGANKNSIKIIGENTDLYTQAYFEYDTKKSFGITRSHLRFGKKPIRGSYLVTEADFIACHNQSFLDKYDIVSELKEGGTFLLNCSWNETEIADRIPADVRRTLARKKTRFYYIDANAAANSIGLADHASMVLQAAFFSLAAVIPIEDALSYMKAAAEKSFGRKGNDVVRMNHKAIDLGAESVKEFQIPNEWAAEPEMYSDQDTALPEDHAQKKSWQKYAGTDPDEPAFIRNILRPINALKGDLLPVSAFEGYEDGTMPLGTTAYEKRGIATRLPVWDSKACVQCNRCSFVCPHAVIRPYLLNEQEVKKAPEGFVTVPAKGVPENKNLSFSLQISDMDCTSCGSCVSVCPLSGTALRMEPVKKKLTLTPAWEYGLTISEKADVFPQNTVKGSQFKQPLCEFSGACAGCGETPYAKLLTQLFGDRMYWANGTGCSQAWGAAMPSIPYTINKEGRGPAWSNSLFENNAEFCLGMYLSVKQQRNKTRAWIEEISRMLADGSTNTKTLAEAEALQKAIAAWLYTFSDVNASLPAGRTLAEVLEKTELSGEHAAYLKMLILRHPEHLAKQPVWMYGGDGWAYDIGFGGLDHVISMGEDINVFIVDTEVYSNTGGQSSKATPLGAVAQFASSGKKTRKKDLGKMMMAYGNCYVASVAMGADMNQLLKAVTEAEAYPGPSIIIAYAPCISHGIKAGMSNAQEEMKRAVEAGYWSLYRYNPANKEKPFTLDSKEPTLPYRDFLAGEVRYSSLYHSFPNNAEKLFRQAEEDAAERYKALRDMEN